MADATTTVRRDLTADLTVVTVVGELTVAASPGIRKTLSKCLAECPSALVVDLTGLVVVPTPVWLTVFLAAAQHQEQLPEVPVLLCGDVVSDGAPKAYLGSLGAYANLGTALEAVANARRLAHRWSTHLPATREAPRLARTAVSAACRRWGVEHIVDSARLIASELVTNVVRHTNSDAELELSLRPNFLHLRVRDGSTVAPQSWRRHNDSLAPGGRGLSLVERCSSGWGHVVDAKGKVVWATLRIRSAGA